MGKWKFLLGEKHLQFFINHLWANMCRIAHIEVFIQKQAIGTLGRLIRAGFSK